MSTTVDQRVVEMRFDNDRFEKNVATSMSTLAKLKQSLNLTGASKGLESINAAAKNNNLSALGTAAETVGAKFSAMQIVGVTALANIANSAVNSAKQMVSALTIDPIKTGFSEYELKMDSVKTIVASTGEELSVVNKYLNELNEYSDETIYSFADMTQNIGKFTNAGIKLEDAVMAIKGISNEAAVSGANANEASRAMYNFSQALSSGYVKLIDWKSIENANMATKEFKQELIDTALALGTVTDAGDGMYTTLEGNAFNATKNFNEVFQDQWMTSEVLIETLKRYADESTDIGKKAKAAAQDVTKLTQVFDIAKETAQSGWARTWELMFGDLNQAKALFTPISNFLSGIIEGISDARNNLLEAALDSPFAKIIEKVENVSKATEKVVDTTAKYADIVNKVIGGEYGEGEDRWRKLTEEGYNWAKVQNIINEQLGSEIRHDEKLWEVSSDLNTARATTVEQITAMGDAQLRSLGFTTEEIQSLRDLEKAASAAGYTLEEAIANPELLSGRSLLIDGFKNIGKVLGQFATAAKDAWREIFPPKSLEERAQKLYNLIAGFREFTSSLILNEDTADNLKRTLKGVFAAFDIILTVVGGPLKWAIDAVVKLLGEFDIDILAVTADIGDAIVAVRDWIDEHNIFLKGLELIGPHLKKAIDAIREWFNEFRESHGIGEDFVDGFINGLTDGVKRVWQAAVELGQSLINKLRGTLDEHSPSREAWSIGWDFISGLVLGIVDGAIRVYNAVKNLGSTIITTVKESTIADGLSNIKEKIKSFFIGVGEFIKGIDFGKLLAAGLGAGMLVAVFKIANVMKALTSPLEGLGSMLEGLGDMFESIGAQFKAAAFEKRMNGVLNFAKAIGILALSIFLLANIETGKLWATIGAIAALAAIMAGLAALSGLLSRNKQGLVNFDFGVTAMGILGIAASILILSIALKKLSSIDQADLPKTLKLFAGIVIGLSVFMAAFGTFVKGAAAWNMNKAGGLLIKLSVSMLLMIAVIKLASKLDNQEIARGVGVILAVGVLFTAFMAVSKLAGEHAGKAGTMLLKMSVAMLLMVAIVKLASGLKQSEINRGVKLIAGVGAVFIGLIAISKLAGANSSKAGSMLLAMSLSILVMGFAIKQLANMKMSDVVKGMGIVTAMGVLFAGLIYISKFSGENATKAGVMLILMSGALIIMTGVLFILSKMDTKSAYKALGIVTVLGLVFAGLIAVTHLANTEGMLGVLIVMSVAITLMTGAIIALSLIDGGSLGKATAALGSVMTAFALMIAATSLIRNPVKMVGTLISLTLVVAALALVVWGLSHIDATNVIPNAAGLAILVAAMSGVLVLLDKMNVGNSITGVLSLLAMAAPLAAFVGVLYLMQNIENATKNAIALSLLATVMTLLLIPLGLVGANITGALLGVVSLLAMAVPLVAFVGVLALMENLDNAMSNTMALIALTTTLTLLLIPLTVIGAFVAAAAAGVVALLAMAVPLVAFVGILYLMEGLENATVNANLLVDMMTVMTGLLTTLAIIGPLALIGETAMVGLVALMGVVAGFAVAVGALSTWFPSLEEFLNKGLGLLSDIAFGIGKFAGDLVAGFADGVMEIIPIMGTKLSEFMKNAEYFIAGASNIDEKVVTGVNCLAKALLALTAAELISGLASWFTGGLDLPGLGTELSEFMDNAKEFVAGAGQLDESMLTGVQALAKVILTLTAVDILQGLTSWFTGGTSLTEFSSQLPQLGADIAAFATHLGTFTEAQTSSVNFAAQAIVKLAEAAQDIPNEGGWAAKIFGENSIATFGSKLPQLGTDLKNFVTNLGTFDKAQVDTTDCAGKAIAKLAEAAQDIPNEGGWAAKIFGENSIATFGTKLPQLGTDLKNFVANLGTFSKEQVTTTECAGNAIVALAKAGESIDGQAGWAKKLFGDDSLSTFGKELSGLGTSLKNFVTNLGTFSSSQVSTVTAAVDAIGAFAKLADADLKGAKNQFSGFGEKLVGLGENIRTFILNMPASETISATVKDLNTLLNAINKLAKADVDAATNFTLGMRGMATSGVDAFIKTFSNKDTDVKKAAGKLVTAATEGVKNSHAEMKKSGETLINKFATAISDSKDVVKKNAKILAEAGKDILRGYYDSYKSAGVYLVDGFAAGISARTWKAEAKAAAMAAAALEAAKEELDVNSPSKEFFRIGNFTVAGFVNALIDGAKDTFNAGSEMASAAKDGLNEAIGKVLNVFDADMDMNPTIRPVLDLSGVNSGVAAIDGMFNGSHNIGVMSTLSAINTAMSGNRQNGNADVISALNKLGKQLGNTRSNTYNINGITYDDGSNVAAALETIVRAARVERRV